MVVKTSLGDRLLQRWRLLNRMPGGRWLFNRILAHMVPYSGSIAARITDLEPGYARIELPDRRRVRNHLNSIHAVALVNLGELTSGLAMMAALPAGMRGIVTALNIVYIKKARGTLVAECHSQLSPDLMAIDDDVDFKVVTDIRDHDGDMVAQAEVTWRLGQMR